MAVDFVSLGHWTLKQDLAEKGLEADDCYDITHLPDVRGKQELDLTIDPPPDLAIEIDVTTHSQHRFRIYGALGVPEIWIWKNDQLQPHRLSGGAYKAVPESVELAGCPFPEVSALILNQILEGDLAATRALRNLFATGGR